MSDIEATKFYIRFREDYPETDVGYSALMGFWTLNVETKPFYWAGDIEQAADLSRTVGVAGYLGDVWAGLKRLGKPIPPALDYPEALTEFLGRKVRKGLLEEVRASIHHVFVKPVEHKKFTGFVWKNDAESRRRILLHEDTAEVWMSDVVDFIAEYRSFVLYNHVIGCRIYKGDWSKAPSRDIVEEAVRAMKPAAPAAYILDWGITEEGKTVLVEANDSMSFGGYGLPAVSVARMLSARWYELTR